MKTSNIVITILVIALCIVCVLDMKYEYFEAHTGDVINERFVVVEKMNRQLLICKDNKTGVYYYFEYLQGDYRLRSPVYDSQGQVVRQ